MHGDFSLILPMFIRPLLALFSNSISLKIEPLRNLCYYDDVTNFQQDLWLYGRDIALANVTHFARGVVFF